MKKKNLKSLKLRKKTIFNFESSIVGGIISGNCPETYMCPMQPIGDTTLRPIGPMEENHATIFWC